jgi:hypothetical protein
MTSAGTKIKDHKQRGEWAEMRFMAIASEHGLRVSKPYGDSARYDFVVESKGRLLRVQVKSTTAKRYGGYLCHAVHSISSPYTPEQIDFFAIMVIPKEVWYIVPAEVVLSNKTYLLLSPGRKKEKYGRYREAWNLLKQAGSKDAELAEPEPGLVQAEKLPVTTEPGGEPGEIPEMRGEIEPAPGAYFNQDLLRKRMGACFEFVRGRRR